jgi:hypothetical protein
MTVPLAGMVHGQSELRGWRRCCRRQAPRLLLDRGLTILLPQVDNRAEGGERMSLGIGRRGWRGASRPAGAPRWVGRPAWPAAAGRCGESLSLRGGRLTLTAGKRIPNSRRVCPLAFSGVYGVEANRGRVGSASTINEYGRRGWRRSAFGGLPGAGLAVSACGPLSRYLASYPVTVPRAVPARPPPPPDALPPFAAPRASAAPRAPPDPACGRGSRRVIPRRDCLVKPSHC